MLYFLKYTDDIEEGFAGTTVRLSIKIRPKYKDDKGLLEHEIEHTEQCWRTLGFHGLIKKLFPKYHLWCEVQAYKRQIKFSPNDVEVFAKRLATMYGFNKSIEEALRLLA